MNPGAHALDRRLRELRAAQQALVSEARDLEADATCALLTGDRLTGVTAEQARPALAQVEQMRQGLSLLDDLLSRIKAQQNEADVDAAALMLQLNGPGIVLGAEPGVSADGLAPPSGSRSSSGAASPLTPCSRPWRSGSHRPTRSSPRSTPPGVSCSSPRPGDDRGSPPGSRATGSPACGRGGRCDRGPS